MVTDIDPDIDFLMREDKLIDVATVFDDSIEPKSPRIARVIRVDFDIGYPSLVLVIIDSESGTKHQFELKNMKNGRGRTYRYCYCFFAKEDVKFKSRLITASIFVKNGDHFRLLGTLTVDMDSKLHYSDDLRCYFNYKEETTSEGKIRIAFMRS